MASRLRPILLVLLCFTASFAVTHLAPYAHADSLPCGDIIAPENPYNPTSPTTTTPVRDCDRPFGTTTNSVRMQVGSSTLSNGDSVEVPSGGTDLYGPTGFNTNSGSISAFLYKHEGNNYEFYTNLFVATDAPPRPALRAGTYTAVVREDELCFSHEPGRWQSLLARFFKVAHAFCGPSRLATVTFTVTEADPEPEPEAGASSILFLPGIQASRLYTDGSFGVDNRLWEPGINNLDFQSLSMTESGDSIKDVFTKLGDVIDRASYPGEDIIAYETFIDYLNELEASGDIASWQAFAYDWRYDVRDVVKNGTRIESGEGRVFPVGALLSEAGRSENGKVTIIAHSNGGLLAKAMLANLVERCQVEDLPCPEEVVDKVILLGTPQLGTPQTIWRLLHGKEVEFGESFVYTQPEYREVVRNIPGVYGLLPGAKYFDTQDEDDEPIIKMTSEVSWISELQNAYPNGIESVEDLEAFLVGDPFREVPEYDNIYQPGIANPSLVRQGLETQAELSLWEAPDGVAVIEIVGTGIVTMAGIEYVPILEKRCVLGIINCIDVPIPKPKPIPTLYGDETVVSRSAEGYEGEKQVFYFDFNTYNASVPETAEATHQNFTEPAQVQSLLTTLLTGNDELLPSFFSTTRPSYEGLVYDGISANSPVYLGIEDEEGNFTGRVIGDDGTSYVVEGVPGSIYFEIGSSTYIYVPSDTEYTTTVTAYDTGSFTLIIDELADGEISTTKTIVTQPILRTTTATFSKTNEQFSTLAVDIDGDGVVDEEKTLNGEPVSATSDTLKLLRRDVDRGTPGGDNNKEFVAEVYQDNELLEQHVLAWKTGGGGRINQRVENPAVAVFGYKTHRDFMPQTGALLSTAVDSPQLHRDGLRFNKGFGLDKSGKRKKEGFGGDEGAGSKDFNQREFILIDLTALERAATRVILDVHSRKTNEFSGVLALLKSTDANEYEILDTVPLTEVGGVESFELPRPVTAIGLFNQAGSVQVGVEVQLE